MSGELKNIADVIRYLDAVHSSGDSAWIEGFTIGCAASGIISDSMADELQQIYRNKSKLIQKKHTGINTAVLNCVTKQGPLHASEISSVLNLSKTQVHNALYQLQKGKAVKNLGKNNWKAI